MSFGCSFTRQQCLVDLKTKAFENVFQSSSYLYRLHVNYKNHKGTSPSTSLAYLSQHFLVVFVDQYEYVSSVWKNKKEETSPCFVNFYHLNFPKFFFSKPINLSYLSGAPYLGVESHLLYSRLKVTGHLKCKPPLSKIIVTYFCLVRFCILREFYGTNSYLCNNYDHIFPLKIIIQKNLIFSITFQLWHYFMLK